MERGGRGREERERKSVFMGTCVTDISGYKCVYERERRRGRERERKRERGRGEKGQGQGQGGTRIFLS